MSKTPRVAPPSPRQIDAFRSRLQRCQYIETAAALLGVPKRTVFEWIKLGRQGVADYVEFVDMLDIENAKLAERCLDPIMRAAFEDGNIQAAQWIYKQRCAKREEHHLEKQLKLEDEIDEKLSYSEPNADDVEAAERRAEQLAEEAVH